jgi:hypothetical protein
MQKGTIFKISIMYHVIASLAVLLLAGYALVSLIPRFIPETVLYYEVFTVCIILTVLSVIIAAIIQFITAAWLKFPEIYHDIVCVIAFASIPVVLSIVIPNFLAIAGSKYKLFMFITVVISLITSFAVILHSFSGVYDMRKALDSVDENEEGEE